MDFITDAEIITRALEDYYKESISGNVHVIQQPPMRELINDMELSSLVREGGLTGEKLADFLDIYLSAITRIYHPANIAHQQAVPHYMAGLAGLIDQFVSSDGSIYELGPASVSIEYFLINWLLEKVGWKPSPLDPGIGEDGNFGGGILTHGGSMFGKKGIRMTLPYWHQPMHIIRLPGRSASWVWDITAFIHLRLMKGVSLSRKSCGTHINGLKPTGNKSWRW